MPLYERRQPHPLLTEQIKSRPIDSQRAFLVLRGRRAAHPAIW
jgi:hypothetical protein